MNEKDLFLRPVKTLYPPEEWKRMKEAGKLDNIRVKPLSVFGHVLAYLWGIITLGTGLFLLALILIGQFTAH